MSVENIGIKGIIVNEDNINSVNHDDGDDGGG